MLPYHEKLLRAFSNKVFSKVFFAATPIRDHINTYHVPIHSEFLSWKAELCTAKKNQRGLALFFEIEINEEKPEDTVMRLCFVIGRFKDMARINPMVLTRHDLDTERARGVHALMFCVISDKSCYLASCGVKVSFRKRDIMLSLQIGLLSLLNAYLGGDHLFTAICEHPASFRLFPESASKPYRHGIVQTASTAEILQFQVKKKAATPKAKLVNRS